MEGKNESNGGMHNDDMQVDIQFDKSHETEMCRIISQYLQEKGFNEAANVLQKESGVYLEGAVIQKFRNLVLDGKFDDVVGIIHEIEYEEHNVSKVKQAIYEQKYLELLEKQDTVAALSCLRNEVITSTKECNDFMIDVQTDDQKNKIKILSSLIMCKSLEDIQLVLPNWDGANGTSRQKLLNELQSYISPQKMLEDGKLESLLKQSIMYQVSTCKHHDYDKKDYKYSLLEKHKCGKTPLPNICLHSISHHSDEVWYVAISPDGKKLASVGKDKEINIWDLKVTANSLEITLKNCIKKCHSSNDQDINSVMWNKNSDLLLTSCENAKVFDVNQGDCLKVLKGNSDKVSCAVFVDNGSKVVTAEVEKCMKLWNMNGSCLHTWDTDRYIDVVCNLENSLIAYYTGSYIAVLDVETKQVVTKLEETGKVRSITMSQDGKYILANSNDKNDNTKARINLWNIESAKVVQTYVGHIQEKYVLKCAFGGKFENYVLCGSEDDAIYIWNRHSGELLDVLKEHKDTVNNIAWATQIPNFFFSCADDQTIKVWGVDKDHKVKVTIPSKFKTNDNISENGSDMDMNPDRDSESIGDSSLSEGSVFSVSDEDL